MIYNVLVIGAVQAGTFHDILFKLYNLLWLFTSFGKILLVCTTIDSLLVFASIKNPPLKSHLINKQNMAANLFFPENVSITEKFWLAGNLFMHNILMERLREDVMA